MSDKVKIELRPFDALAILSFLREYVNYDTIGKREFTAIHEAVAAFEKEVYSKMSSSQIEEAILENKVNFLTNRQPPRQPPSTEQ